MINRITSQVREIAWFCMIACLPVTSLPLVSRMLGADSVASPAILFLLLFMAAWLIAGLRGRFLVNQHVFGLLLFCLAAVLSSLLSLFIDVPLFKNFDNVRPMVSGVSTLAIGFLFYAVASSYPEENGIREKTFRIINYGGLAILIWCVFQAVS